MLEWWQGTIQALHFFLKDHFLLVQFVCLLLLAFASNLATLFILSCVHMIPYIIMRCSNINGRMSYWYQSGSHCVLVWYIMILYIIGYNRYLQVFINLYDGIQSSFMSHDSKLRSSSARIWMFALSSKSHLVLCTSKQKTVPSPARQKALALDKFHEIARLVKHNQIAWLNDVECQKYQMPKWSQHIPNVAKVFQSHNEHCSVATCQPELIAAKRPSF